MLGLAYQLHGGIDFVHLEALEGMLATDGVLILVIALSPQSNNSLFSKVRGNERDFGMITILVLLSSVLLMNGLLDLTLSRDGSGLIAGIGVIPEHGVTTLLGIFFLLAAMIALLLLSVAEFLAAHQVVT
jgi:hypothetical protein